MVWKKKTSGLQYVFCPAGGVRERSGSPVQPDGARPEPPVSHPVQPHRFPAGGAALLHDQRRHGARRAPQLRVSVMNVHTHSFTHRRCTEGCWCVCFRFKQNVLASCSCLSQGEARGEPQTSFPQGEQTCFYQPKEKLCTLVLQFQHLKPV